VTLYLTIDDVLRIHEAEVGDPIVDLGLLESAILRPQTTVGGMDAYP
jgi:death-on-curing protein